MKRLVKELSQDIPHLRSSLLGALGNIQPRHLLDKRFNDLLQGGDNDPQNPDSC